MIPPPWWTLAQIILELFFPGAAPRDQDVDCLGTVHGEEPRHQGPPITQDRDQRKKQVGRVTGARMGLQPVPGSECSGPAVVEPWFEGAIEGGLIATCRLHVLVLRMPRKLRQSR